ncbi:RdgB/HAM1 family non-canonical purine NTP pyrophosphatase [soil metagenome]
MHRPWVVASRNEGKLVELRALFRTHGIGVVDLRDVGVTEDATAEDDIECFETFEQNALAKARYFSALLPGRIVVADDSGLVVDSLDGAPGVRSKRWSGRSDIGGAVLDAANNALLVSSVARHDDRSARFVCAAAWSNGRTTLVARGVVVGRIVNEPAGAAGFGYDPHVFVDELGMTMAQATLDEKQHVSHRARAFLALFDLLRSEGAMK